MKHTPSRITIDGPSASGKSTIGGLLAEKLGYIYFDTGVMYRAVTLEALERGIPIEDEDALTRLAEEVVIDVTLPTVEDGRQYTVLVDGKDVTWEIRGDDVEQAVSPVSAYAGVREALTLQQRRIGEGGRIVMVGRDIGTVVMPDAELKIYLTASVEERARRRYLEKIGRGEAPRFEDVLATLRRRDEIDSSRAVAPLRPAEDAIVIDTENLTVDEVLACVLEIVHDPAPDQHRAG